MVSDYGLAHIPCSTALGSCWVLPQCHFGGHSALRIVAQLWVHALCVPNRQILQLLLTVLLLGELQGPVIVSVLCNSTTPSGHGLAHAPSSTVPWSCLGLLQCPFVGYIILRALPTMGASCFNIFSRMLKSPHLLILFRVVRQRAVSLLTLLTAYGDWN